MDHYFLDESGDCSFSQNSIFKHFVITIISFNKYDMHTIKNHLKRVFVNFYNQGWDKTLEIKACNLFNNRSYGDKAIMQVFGSLIKIKSLKVNYIAVNKDGIKSTSLKKASYGVVYNYFTGVLLSELILSGQSTEINLIFDRRNKETHENRPFKEYLQTQVIGKAFEKGVEANLVLRPEDSTQSKGLQAADFISWAIFRKFESRDDRFLDMIKNNINIKREWYV